MAPGTGTGISCQDHGAAGLAADDESGLVELGHDHDAPGTGQQAMQVREIRVFQKLEYRRTRILDHALLAIGQRRPGQQRQKNQRRRTGQGMQALHAQNSTPI